MMSTRSDQVAPQESRTPPAGWPDTGSARRELLAELFRERPVLALELLRACALGEQADRSRAPRLRAAPDRDQLRRPTGLGPVPLQEAYEELRIPE